MTATAVLPLPLHNQFLQVILPYVESHASVIFGHLRCPHRRADSMAEMIALSWKWFSRLVQQGKDPSQFPSALATFAAKAVKSGRRLAAMERPKDVLSSRAQQLHGFKVEHLPPETRTSFEELYSARGQRTLDAFEERLQDNSITPVPDQVQFRIDFSAWLQTLTPRERRLIRAMARNERTTDLSKRFDLSPGRVSQLRREFQQGWERFTADPHDLQSAS